MSCNCYCTTSLVIKDTNNYLSLKYFLAAILKFEDKTTTSFYPV